MGVMDIKKIIIGPLGWGKQLFDDFTLDSDVIYFDYQGNPEVEVQELITLIQNDEVIVYAFSFGGLILQSAISNCAAITQHIAKVFYYDALAIPSEEVLIGFQARREVYETEAQIFDDYLAEDRDNVKIQKLVLDQFIMQNGKYQHKFSNEFMCKYIKYILNQDLKLNFDYKYQIYTSVIIEEVAKDKQQLIKPEEHLMMIERFELVKADFSYRI